RVLFRSQARGALGKLARPGQVDRRGKERQRAHLAGADELRDGQDLDRLAALRTPGDRRVRGPQVDADDEVLPRCHAPLREGASLTPRRGLREPGMEPGRQLETSPELRPTPSAEAAS